MNYNFFDFFGFIIDTFGHVLRHGVGNPYKDEGFFVEEEVERKNFPLDFADIYENVELLMEYEPEMKLVKILQPLNEDERIVVSVLSIAALLKIEMLNGFEIVNQSYGTGSSGFIVKKCERLFGEGSRLIRDGYIEVGYFSPTLDGIELYILPGKKIKRILSDIERKFYVFSRNVKSKGRSGRLDNNVDRDKMFEYNSHQFFDFLTETDGIRNVNLIPERIKQVDTLFLDDEVQEELGNFEFIVKKAIRNEIESAIGLFYGPPGTGKSMAGKRIAYDLKLPFVKVRLPDLLHHYYGASEARLRYVLNKAQEKGYFLQLDEIDAIVSNRADLDHHHEVTFVDTFLTLLEDYNGILVMTTNFSESIDPALERRIDYIIHFPIPSPSIRKELWRYYLNKFGLKGNINMKKLSEQMVAGGDIYMIAKRLKIWSERKGIKKITTRNILNFIKKGKFFRAKRVGFIDDV